MYELARVDEDHMRAAQIPMEHARTALTAHTVCNAKGHHVLEGLIGCRRMARHIELELEVVEMIALFLGTTCNLVRGMAQAGLDIR